MDLTVPFRESSNILASVCKTIAGTGDPTALDQQHATTNALKESTPSPLYHQLLKRQKKQHRQPAKTSGSYTL